MSKTNGNGDGRTLGQQHFDLAAKRQGMESEVERLKAEIRRADERAAWLREQIAQEEQRTKAAEAEATSLAFKATAQSQRNERLAAALDEIEKVLVTHNLIDTENGETLAQAILRAHDELVEAKAKLREGSETAVRVQMHDGETLEQCCDRYRPQIDAARAVARRSGKGVRLIVTHDGATRGGLVLEDEVHLSHVAPTPEISHVAPPCAHFANGEAKRHGRHHTAVDTLLDDVMADAKAKLREEPKTSVCVQMRDGETVEEAIARHRPEIEAAEKAAGRLGQKARVIIGSDIAGSIYIDDINVSHVADAAPTGGTPTIAYEILEIADPTAETVERWRAMLASRYEAAAAASAHMNAFNIVTMELRLLAIAATGDDEWLHDTEEED